MATRIRLKRFGSKHNAHFRIAVMDQRSQRDGRAVEEIGHYDPNTDPATVEIKRERAEYWLSVGAQPSDTVRKLLARAGIGVEAAPEAAEEAAVEEAPAEEAPAEEAPAEEAPAEEAPAE